MASKMEEHAPRPPPFGGPAVTGIPVGSATLQLQSEIPAQWSTGLCDCGKDVCNCCVTMWCPCITFGQIAEIIDRGSPSCGASGALYAIILLLTNCQCVYSCFFRTKLRAQYSIPESRCPDFIIHCFCEACALCQAYRELEKRGFDMTIGWHANMERQGRQPVFQAPPVQDGMVR